MKKFFLITLMILAAAYGISAQNGVIRELTGDVELKRSGSQAFTAASAGDEVTRDTIVSTGFKSTAVIAVGSSMITVRPLTRLSLAEIQSSSGTETLNVNLQAGRVRVDVKPPAGAKANCTVQSPSATASVRGTSFDFDTINLTVNEGTVAFSGVSGPIAMVKSGGANFVGIEGKPVDTANIIASVLLPSAPVGSSASGTIQPSAPSTGDLGIIIEYPKK
ncbi:MAG: FecR family protein [Treponema sp.]|nr:FecR family protein [Treponema sp.]